MATATVIKEPALAAAATKTKTHTLGATLGGFSVMWSVRNATAAGDLGTTLVSPVAKDGTVLPITLTPTSTEAKVLFGGIAVKVDYYDHPGIEKISLSVTNSAAAARNVVVDLVYSAG